MTDNAKPLDESLAALNQLVGLYEDILAHDGYGDLQLQVRIINRQSREVILLCGKEYRYQVTVPPEHQQPREGFGRFKVVKARGNQLLYRGEERRKQEGDRREGDRRTQAGPRNFKLERRNNGGDRRKGRDRRGR